MAKQSVLLLGGKSGIAGALNHLMTKDYDTKLISRSSNDFPGDLTSDHFREQLANTFSPDIIVSSFGNWSACKSVTKSIETFLISNIDLFEKFKNKGCLKTFVIISSAVARFSANPMLNVSELNYLISKRLISDYFQQLQLWGKNKVRIIISEPGFIDTNFADIRNRIITHDDSDVIHKGDIKPLDVQKYAESLLSIIKLNHDTNFSIYNHIGDYFKV